MIQASISAIRYLTSGLSVSEFFVSLSHGEVKSKFGFGVCVGGAGTACVIRVAGFA